MDAIGFVEQRQVDGQAALLPILLVKYTWGTNLRDAAVILFVDSDAARLAVVWLLSVTSVDWDHLVYPRRPT